MTRTLILLLLATSAHAQVNITWTAPTEEFVCTQTQPIQDLAGYRIWLLLADIDAGEPLSYEVTGLGSGEHTFAATAYQADKESILTKNLSTMVGPPTVVSSAAKVPVRTQDAHTLVVAGTVPVGTECSETQTLNGHNLVPSDSVNWSGTVRSITVYAQCEYSAQ